MSDYSLAYHITFGTYGSRLHGDDRGTVHRSMNQPNDPILGRNDPWQRVERSLLKFDPVVLNPSLRLVAEAVIPGICRKGGWQYHIAAAREDHVHVLLSTQADGKAVRRWFKVWLGQELSQSRPLPEDATWWAECGSVKWVWTQDYFERVFDYIRRQRTTPDSQSPARIGQSRTL